jgi:Holliday junction resolvase-like predicted endonuclease
VLCFVEVKTRSTRELKMKTGVAAVDRHQRPETAAVVREYPRRLPPSCQCRFDAVSVYYDRLPASRPQIELLRNSSLTAANKICGYSDKEVLECLS